MKSNHNSGTEAPANSRAQSSIRHVGARNPVAQVSAARIAASNAMWASRTSRRRRETAALSSAVVLCRRTMDAPNDTATEPRSAAACWDACIRQRSRAWVSLHAGVDVQRHVHWATTIDPTLPIATRPIDTMV